MKFLIHSNAPTVATGYGVQCRYLADFLADAGHEVAVSVTFGHQYGISDWQSPSGHTVRLYPSGYLTNSPDLLYAHAQHWFEGDPSAGWIITLLDVWCLKDARWGLHDWQVAAWTPVDHLPTPPEVLEFFHNTGATPMAMSRFGEDMMTRAGLNPAYVPLAVDTEVFRPTFDLEVSGERVSARQLFGIPHDAFVVGMVAMNKDPYDRKGFNEALRAFGQFWQDHQNAVLFIHTDAAGAAGGINLNTLAVHAAVPDHAIVWTDPYAYRIGLPPDMMAAAYTAMDVLLAPSRGEGFCVPLIEAQACGSPVIASNFSAQPELIGAGWKVAGQLEWDPTQSASYFRAFVPDIIDQLEAAHAADLDGMQSDAIEFAAQYDARKVFDEHWRPFLDTLQPPEPVERDPMTNVDVIVPLMRPENLDRLMTSMGRHDDIGVIIVHDDLDDEVAGYPAHTINTRRDRTGYADKVNRAVERSTADWVLVVGDDVEFTPGWFEAAAAMSTVADVIGTNDSEPGRTRNPEVAAGRHADHFFIRREYIDEHGASLDGPGVLMPTAYTHWFVDREVIELAKARGVYAHADECRIIHHHPGYDGDEDARHADPVYMTAVEASEDDQRTWLSRAPLIEAHRVTRSAA